MFVVGYYYSFLRGGSLLEKITMGNFHYFAIAGVALDTLGNSLNVAAFAIVYD